MISFELGSLSGLGTKWNCHVTQKSVRLNLEQLRSYFV